MEIIKKYFSDFSDLQVQQFSALEAFYTEWNARINLVSRKDIGSLYEKHVLHSLAIAAVFDFPPGTQIVDIGTGGGFPGIPLAILFPEVDFLLVDAIGKKIKVVQELVKTIHLKNVIPWHGRAEQIHKRSFDFAISRAVAPLGDLWKWARPLLEKESNYSKFKNGLICLKGGDLAIEIQESGLRPHIWPIASFFSEEFFSEKFILYIPS